MSEETNGATLHSNPPLSPTIQAWIENEAMPIDVNIPSAFNADIDTFMMALGENVELLGLGEALHGGEAILHFRNRLFQRLVEQHGYVAIAIESSFPRSRLLNDFVMGHDSAAYEEIEERSFSRWLKGIPANRELLEWMRNYNTTHLNKIYFYGFDAPTDAGPTDSPRMLLHWVLDFLASVDPIAATTYHDQIEPLLGEDALWENPEVAMNPTLGIGLSPLATALRIATETMISELHIRQPEFVAARGMEAVLEAMHHAALARQLLNYHAVLAAPSSNRQGRLLSLRDAMMADNLSYIVARHRPQGKVLAFAHNAHLQRRKVEWQFGTEAVHWFPVGTHLEVRFGTRYSAIASAVGISPENGIAEPEANTLEAMLAHDAAPVHILPTHRGRHLPAEVLRALPTRSGNMKNRSYSGLTPHSIIDFDWLLTFSELK